MIRSIRLRDIAVVTLFVACFCQVANAATRKFIAADSSKKRIAIINEDGSTAWEYKIGPLHDLHALKNGNLLIQSSWTRVIELDPKSEKVVWSYEAKESPGNKNRKIEIHAFQRLDDGNTMVAESGRGRIVEVDANGKITKAVKLQIANPHPHRDTRLARKLDNGHYLVCHEGDGAVREYDATGKVVWDYEVPLFGNQPREGHGVEGFGNQCFSAIRLKNGNTLIGTGNGHSIIEVTPKREIVWKLEQAELPGIQLAWVTTLQVLPSGNIVIGNCHAGDANPQLIEVDRNKKVVWTFKDFDRFGNALTNSQILTVDGELLPLP